MQLESKVNKELGATELKRTKEPFWKVLIRQRYLYAMSVPFIMMVLVFNYLLVGLDDGLSRIQARFFLFLNNNGLGLTILLLYLMIANFI